MILCTIQHPSFPARQWRNGAILASRCLRCSASSLVDITSSANRTTPSHIAGASNIRAIRSVGRRSPMPPVHSWMLSSERECGRHSPPPRCLTPAAHKGSPGDEARPIRCRNQLKQPCLLSSPPGNLLPIGVERVVAFESQEITPPSTIHTYIVAWRAFSQHL